MFNGVEVRALCRPVKFFHTDLDKPFLYLPHFVQGEGGIGMLTAGMSFRPVAPKHKARSIQKCFVESGVEELDWLAQSPDLSSIKHLRD